MAEAVSDALWTAEELVAATGGRLTSPVTRVLRAVSIDSRGIGNGDVFVAIKGDKNDGHD
jgi:UDP-N-acetylmuramoyl-tripeptide--D-alanyl-D-alanine ligase